MFGPRGGRLRHPNLRAGRGDGQPTSKHRGKNSWRSFVVLLVGLAFAIAGSVGVGATVSQAQANSGGTDGGNLPYSGQGIPVQQKCSVQDEGGGNPYLLFVFTGGSATNVQLHGISVTDTKVTGGSVHFTTPYVDPPSSLIGKVYVTWDGDAGANPQLVISHGCAGTQDKTVTPQPPSATPPSCEHTNQTVTPPDQEGVVWNPSGPTVIAPEESVLYTASPAEGYQFPDGVTHEWEFTNTFDTSTCPQPPTKVTPASPTATTPNCDNTSEVVTPSDQKGVIWSPKGSTTLQPGDSVTYTASPAEGYAFPDGAQTSWTFKNTFDTSTCEQPPTVVTPVAPTATPPSCEYPNQTVTPSDQEGVIWEPVGSTVLKPGDSVLYTATPAEGFKFPEGATHEWEFTNTFDTSECPQPPTVVQVPATPDVNDACGPNNATWVVPSDDDTFEWTLQDNGHLVVTIVADNTTFRDGSTSHDYGTAPDSNEQCPPAPVSPTAPTSVDQCEPSNGPTNDGANIPADENFTYVDQATGETLPTGFTRVQGTSITVDAVANEGVTVTEGAQTEWSFDFTKVMCHQPPPIHQGKLIKAHPSCGAVRFGPNRNDFAVHVWFGKFNLPEPDGKVTIAPGESKTVKTSRTHLDFIAFGHSKNGRVVLSQDGHVTVKQHCGRHHQPPRHHHHNPPPVCNGVVKNGVCLPSTTSETAMGPSIRSAASASAASFGDVLLRASLYGLLMLFGGALMLSSGRKLRSVKQQR